MKYIFQWSGEYWGFLIKDELFDQDGYQIGKIDKSNKVWANNNTYLGDLIEDSYVMRPENLPTIGKKFQWIKGKKVAAPVAHVNRVGRVKWGGWMDPLTLYKK